MTLPLEPLPTTDRLRGIHKHWPCNSENDYSLNLDYIQKVSFSVQDFNDSLCLKESVSRENVVYGIVLVTWIAEAIPLHRECYRRQISSSFAYARETELEQKRLYLEAIRSFVFAHPLETNQHKNFGLNGDLICIDIRNKGVVDGLMPIDSIRLLTPQGQGLRAASDRSQYDVVLKSYSKQDDPVLFTNIGLNLSDVRDAAALYLDKLFAFDRYIYNLKKRDYLAREIVTTK